MNEMRKLMEAIEDAEYSVLQDIDEAHGDVYAAAYLYVNSDKFGRTKPELAKVLHRQLGIDPGIASKMIDAIDAYEDIKDAKEFKA